MKAITEYLTAVREKTGRGMSEILNDWMMACLSAVVSNEDIYMDIVKRYDSSRDIMNTFAKAFGELSMKGAGRSYEDVLGPIYSAVASYDKSHLGQYFTPQPVADMMAKMLIGDIPEGKLTTVNEPACGSGVMVLGACKAIGTERLNRVHFTLNDIDRTCARMAALQLLVYNVPNWMVTRGNTLSLESFEPVASCGIQPKFESCVFKQNF